MSTTAIPQPTPIYQLACLLLATLGPQFLHHVDRLWYEQSLRLLALCSHNPTDAIWAAAPTTVRGQPTPLSSDPKGERIAYAVRDYLFFAFVASDADPCTTT